MRLNLQKTGHLPKNGDVFAEKKYLQFLAGKCILRAYWSELEQIHLNLE